MFKLLGILLAIYTVSAVVAGEVYAKSGMSGRRVSKQESPKYYWGIIGIYAALSVMLVCFF